jgi:hypothetical protein
MKRRLQQISFSILIPALELLIVIKQYNSRPDLELDRAPNYALICSLPIQKLIDKILRVLDYLTVHLPFYSYPKSLEYTRNFKNLCLLPIQN